VFECKQNKMLL